MKQDSVLTPEQMSFVCQGTPRPRGLWTSALGRLLCRMLGHDAIPGAAYFRDDLPRATLHVWAWACPRCALRFARMYYETPADDGALERVALTNMHELYLDVLHETNLRQHLLGRAPVRAVASLERPTAPQVIRF